MGRGFQVLSLLVLAVALLAGGACLFDCCAGDPDHGAATDTCCTIGCACQATAALPTGGAGALPEPGAAAVRPDNDRLSLPLFADAIFQPPRA